MFNRIRNFYKVNGYDLRLHLIFTALATVVNFLSIYFLTSKFGKDEFASYVYYGIFTQIIFTLGDLGIKNSYFSEIKDHKGINFFYLVFIKLAVSVFLFLIFFVYFNSYIFFSFLFVIVGTSIYPTFLLQGSGLFRVIGFNNLIYRLVPLFFLPLISDIAQYNYVSGLILIVSGLFTMFKYSWNKEFVNINFHEFKHIFSSVFKSNWHLSIVNVVSVLEVNLHILLSRYLFDTSSFAIMVQVDRYYNFFKQATIYYYEYLYPKINDTNYIFFQNFIRKVARLALLLTVSFTFVYTVFILDQNYDLQKLVLVLLFFIALLSIVVFNFTTSILFLKYCKDSHNLKIAFFVFFCKMTLFVFLYKLGLFIVPLLLVFSELVFGIYKHRMLSKLNYFPNLRLANL
jgi:hypothetical protein